MEILAIENTLLTPPFDNQITQYNTQISNNITNLNILAIPENEMGTVQITGNEYLKEGNNTIIITVTAPNEITKRQYFVNVYKRNLEEETKYKEEEQKKEEKLEQAYEIEKTSTVTTQENTNQVKEENRNDFIIGALGIILLGILVGIYYKKKTENKNK
ncbi:MAG: cadherin-like beta sandwich domain-containing protein [Clostridia bacterium]